jgi:hypothetical protein
MDRDGRIDLYTSVPLPAFHDQGAVEAAVQSETSEKPSGC